MLFRSFNFIKDASDSPDGNSQVMLALKSGKAIRFEEAKTRPMGRNASGVRGIRLQHDKDEVIGMVAVNVLFAQ